MTASETTGATTSGCPMSADTYNPLDPAHMAYPYTDFAALAAQGPVQFIPALQMYFVLDADLCDEVCADTATFTSKYANNPGPVPPEVQARLPEGYPHAAPLLINNDPPSHRKLRRPVAQFFTPKAVQSYGPLFRRVAGEVLDEIGDARDIEFMSQFADPLPIRVITEILGVPDLGAEDVRRFTDAAFGLIDPTLSHEDRVRFANDIADARDYSQRVIDARRAQPGDDLMSTLVQLEEEGRAAYDDVLLNHFFVLLLGASIETTASLLGNVVYYLLRNDGEYWKAYLEDRSLGEKAIEEALRLKAPAKLLFRNATRDVELGGVSIPQGAFVVPVVTYANFDPKRWPKPEEFLLDRKNGRQHFSFGRDAHFCLGAHLARLEVKIALEAIADRWPGLHLKDEEFDPQFRPHLGTQAFSVLELRR